MHSTVLYLIPPSYLSAFNADDSDLFEDIYWQIEAGGKLIQICFPAIYSSDRLIMWRTSESESELDIKYFLMQHQSNI
jgi:hypothetical protein